MLDVVAAGGKIDAADSKAERQVLARGHILKVHPVTGSIQRRFLVLTPGKLFCFGSQVDDSSSTHLPRNVVALDTAQVALLPDGTSFSLKYGNLGIHRIGLMTKTAQERSDWFAALKRAVTMLKEIERKIAAGEELTPAKEAGKEDDHEEAKEADTGAGQSVAKGRQ